MRLLVFGSTGQLAREVAEADSGRGVEIQCVGRDRADVTSRAEVEQVIRSVLPTCVLNATAYTAVDKAESDAQAAYAVNRDGPSHLADACREADIPLIHVSTDYVFDGSKSSAYVETDEVAPLGVYGASKEAGERAIRTSLKRHIIIRTAWLYSRHGQNFLKTMLRLAQTRREWGVVADQIGMPTAAADLANAVLAAAKRASRGDAVWGTYHFAGTEEASWHQFASEIVAEWRKYVTCNPAVSPIATDQYPTAARRPKNSRLDSRLFIATFGVSSAPRRLRIASTIKALTQDAAKVQA